MKVFFTHLSEALLHSYIQLLLGYHERLLIPDFKFWNTHEILIIYLSSKVCTVFALRKMFGELTREQAHPTLIHKVLTVVDLCLDVTQHLVPLPVQSLQLSEPHQ